jgi:glycosyltransferase involved in cell wall biosynthesis
MVLPASQMTEVSVVVPTHNRSGLLALTLRSVLWQHDVDLEVIVVDDGSTDDTAQVLAALGDPRTRRIHHPTPQGVSAARNHGITEAAGDWVAFVDDDDLWAPDKLTRQLQAARHTGRAWAYAGAVRIDIDHRRVGGNTPPPPPEEVLARLPRWNPMPGGCSNVIASSTLLRAAGPFDHQLVNLADWDLWIRLARAAGRPAWVPRPLVGYRQHGGNRSLDTALILREARMVEHRYGTALDWGGIFRYLAWLCVRSGRRREGLEHFARAAARGQAPTVAMDIAGLLRDRLPLPVRARARPDGHRGWGAEAEAWLASLRP